MRDEMDILLTTGPGNSGICTFSRLLCHTLCTLELQPFCALLMLINLPCDVQIKLECLISDKIDLTYLIAELDYY